MTTPEERTRAVLDTRRFLLALAQPASDGEVTHNIRYRAETLLRHYPDAIDMDIAGLACPNLFSTERGIFTETNQKQRKRRTATSPFLEKMVAHTEPVFIGIGIAFVCVVVALLVSFHHKFG